MTCRECVGVIPVNAEANYCKFILVKKSLKTNYWQEISVTIDNEISKEADIIKAKFGEDYVDLDQRVAALKGILEYFKMTQEDKEKEISTNLQDIAPMTLNILLNSLYPLNQKATQQGNSTYYSYLFFSPFKLAPRFSKKRYRAFTASTLRKTYERLEAVINSKIVKKGLLLVTNKRIYSYNAGKINQEELIVEQEIVEVFPYIWQFKVPVPVYPPYRYHNCYIIGNEVKYLIDPATTSMKHLKLVVDFIEKERESMEGIILTHEHFNSVSQANYLKNRFDLPILASETAAKTLKKKGIEVNLPLIEGDTLALGSYKPMNLDRWHLKVIETPGHTLGHISLIDSRGIAILGDLLLSETHTLVDPRCGSVEALLKTLSKFSKTKVKYGLAGNGDIITNIRERIKLNIKLRKVLTYTILRGLKQGLSTIDELALEIKEYLSYAKDSLSFYTVQNHLQLLLSKGIAAQRGSNYFIPKDNKLSWIKSLIVLKLIKQALIETMKREIQIGYAIEKRQNIC